MTKVNIRQGTLVGGKCSTENGFEFYEFLKIPYAKPPVENLRFKSPQAPEPWQGVRQATEDDETCESAQFNLLGLKPGGLEDCLYLNVFSPKLLEKGSESLPVMVYIHGGGFVMGSGVPKRLNGPDYLIEHNVVVVSINYRLGPLGFLCLDIPEAAGNMGLKDQVMALKWVQKNITTFGGDKNNVTIFGGSAGGASVEYLCISELSRGLFHKAIPQSGSTINHWALNFEVKELSTKLAQTLGCQSDNPKSILEFLLAVPVENLMMAAVPLVGFSMKKPLFLGFVPTLEKDFGDGDAFIADNPYNIMKQQKCIDVPMMKGFCEFEALAYISFKQNHFVELMEKRNVLEFCNHPIDDFEFQEKLSKAYLDDNVKEDKDLPTQSVINFLSDLDFAAGVWISSQLWSNHKSPVYVYMYSYTTTFNTSDIMDKKDYETLQAIMNTPIEKRGAAHAEDEIFTMKLQHMDSSLYHESDRLIIARRSELWTNFAKTGNPTPTTNEVLPIQWPKFNAPEWQYLKIDTELTIESDYKPDKMAVFKQMYEKYRR